MDMLFISHLRLLREALVATVQVNDGHRACNAFSHETIEAALAAFTPTMVVVDASHPEATALVAAVRTHVPKASAEPTGGGTLVELRPGNMAQTNRATVRSNGMQHRTSAFFNQKAA